MTKNINAVVFEPVTLRHIRSSYNYIKIAKKEILMFVILVYDTVKPDMKQNEEY